VVRAVGPSVHSRGMRAAPCGQLSPPWRSSAGSGAGEEVLVTTCERGYRHLEGRAERALGESLSSENPSAVAAHLESAARILADIGAPNDLAAVWVAQAELCAKAGAVVGTKALLERALTVFEELGRLDEAAHTRATLLKLASPA
jgi:hypothetical protein